MKNVEYIPIYKGEYNMTPSEYVEEIEIVEESTLLRDIITSVEWSVMALCMMYLVTAIIR